MIYRWCGLVLLFALVPVVTSAEDDASPEKPADTKPAKKKKKNHIQEKYVALIESIPEGVYEGKATLPWRLYAPEGAESGPPLPLVVGLHGAGARGTDNQKAMNLYRVFFTGENQEKYPAYVLAPQMNRGRSWVKHEKGFKNGPYGQKPPREEMEAMLALVDETIQKHNIDPSRVYVTGQSMGGFGTWEALWRRPDLWAAAVPICGGGDVTTVEKFKDIPIWAWHGSKDPTVPVENSRELIEALKQAGADPKYSEPDTGHASWLNAYRDPEVFAWMFQQKRTDK
ncbi:MAG: prolyl oligopeptidase family serine peptidase [Verrucomicrobiota bacterium]